MSYLPAPNYLGSISSAQNNQRDCTAAGSRSTPQSNVYQSQIRGGNENHQQQYAQSAYGWSDHTSSASATNSHNTYATESWQERSNSGNPYDYRRDVYQTTPQASADDQAYRSRDPYGHQDTQGLNNLAYASGLDAAVPSAQGARASPYQQAEIYTSSVTESAARARTSLPENSSRRYAETNVSQSHPSGQYSMLPDNSPNTAHSQGLSSNAALSHAGSGRNNSSHPSPHHSSSSVARKKNSPSIRNIPSAPNHKQRIATTHSIVPPPVNHNRKASTQAHSSVSANSGNSQSAASSVQKKSSPLQRRATPKQQQRQQQSQSNNETRQTSKQDSAVQQPAANNPQSIANLVSNNQEPEPPVYESVESQEPMPHYIDPTQVFNPYHREYERKRREMAEQEARKAAEEKRLAEASKADEERVQHTHDTSATANDRSEITDKDRAGKSTTNSGGIIHSSTDQSSTAPDSDDMAIELQKMMLKMKEYRKSNPALFQKLWNDMRGGGPHVAPTVPPPQPTQSPSPQVTQASLPADCAKPTAQAKPRAKKNEFESPYPGVPSNGYRVVVEDNPQGLPDLGRFPAERRIRNSYSKNKTDATSQAQQGRQTSDAPRVTPTQTEQPQAAIAEPLPIRIPSAATTQPAESGLAWPEPRRRAVAIAAVHLLKSNAENASVTISTQEICSILERNPSYLDLCTALESRGLKFQRTAFARELLRSVPELQTPVTKTPASNAEAMATVSSAAQIQLPLPATSTTAENSQSLTNPYAPSQVEGNSTNPNSMRQDPNAVKTEKHKPVHKQPNKAMKARTSSSNRPEPPPGSKAAAARKRDFAELIDLTGLNDDDNYVMPEKRPRMESPPVPMNHIQQLENSMRAGFSANPAQPLRFDPQPMNQSRPSMPIAQSPYFRNSLGTQPRFDVYQQPAPQDGGKTRMVLARKIDRMEAMQKSYYDPKTVARDVLIASGRHPSERPLNVHLAGLLGKYSDLDSDIGTFDWDAVDPGGPPPPRVEYVDILAGPPRYKLVGRMRKRMKLVDETHRTQEDKAEVETAEMHPASVARNQSRTQEQSPSPSFKNVRQHSTDRGVLRSHNSKNRESSFTAINSSLPPARKFSTQIPPVPTTQKPQQTSSPKPNMESTNKRRGRPPGSKNKYPSVAALKQQAKATVTEPTVEVAPEPVLHNYKCKWVKCHAELHNLDTLKRHILKKHTPNEKEVQTENFVCWWKRCRYLELDEDGNMAPIHVFKNTEGWAQHITKDHLQPIGQKYGDGPKTTHTGKQVSEGFDLSNFHYKPHISPATRTFSHIDPQSVEAASQRYLTDTNGRATTPLVTSDGNSDHPPDAMVLTRVYPQGVKNEKEKADVTSQNAYLRAHGNKQKDPRRIAEEVVRAHEARKQAIGPGLDRGGCTLINEERRSTFIQAPGISRIVNIDY